MTGLSAEAAAGGLLTGVEDLSDKPRIKPEIGPSDNRLAHPHAAIEPGRRHRCGAARVLDLADVTQMRRPLRSHH